MKKEKRNDGDGTFRRRSDGRWECRVMIGWRRDGRPEYKYLYGKSQRELKDNVKAWREEQAAGNMWEADYTFAEWADIWFDHHKDTIAPTTQDSYRYTLKVLIEYFGDRKTVGIKAFDIEESMPSLTQNIPRKSTFSEFFSPALN